MLTVSFVFLFFRKNFHLVLPAIINQVLEIVLEGKPPFEFKFTDFGVTVDVTIGPLKTTPTAPGSREIPAAPSGSVIHAPDTPPVASTPAPAPTTSVPGSDFDTGNQGGDPLQNS